MKQGKKKHTLSGQRPIVHPVWIMLIRGWGRISQTYHQLCVLNGLLHMLLHMGFDIGDLECPKIADGSAAKSKDWTEVVVGEHEQNALAIFLVNLTLLFSTQRYYNPNLFWVDVSISSFGIQAAHLCNFDRQSQCFIILEWQGCQRLPAWPQHNTILHNKG